MRTLALLVLVAACSNEPSAPPASEGRQPISLLTGTRPHGMRHCPSSVTGSVTKMTETATGVDVTITARDEAAQQRIVELAHEHEKLGNPGSMNIHDGSHRGMGSMGFCPIIHADTAIAVEPAPGGVVIHVTTTDPSKRDALRKATSARVGALAGLPSV